MRPLTAVLAAVFVCLLYSGCSGGCQREGPQPSATQGGLEPGKPAPPEASGSSQSPAVIPEEEDCVVIMDADPDYGPPPLTVSFSAEVECTGKSEVRYHWDFGDGNTSQDPAPQHTYTKAGDYVASVTVTSGQASASDELDITVEEDAVIDE